MSTQSFRSDEPENVPSGRRFDADAAQRILARAGDLQQKHAETMSASQLEAIAAEVGLSPEFVREALAELDASPTPVEMAVRREVARNVERIVATDSTITRRDLVQSVLAATILPLLIVFILPGKSPTLTPFLIGLLGLALAAFFVGFKHPSRRLGAITGGVFGLITFLVLAAASGSGQGSGDASGLIAPFVLIPSMIATGGAAARRFWNRVPSRREN